MAASSAIKDPSVTGTVVLHTCCQDCTMIKFFGEIEIMEEITLKLYTL